MEEMKLTVDTGAVNIAVQDEADGSVIGSFKFIPTDMDIIRRYGKVVDYFNGVTFPENPSEEEYLKLDDEIRGQLDYLLNGSVSEGVFAKCAPLTMISNGDFFFETIIEGIGKLIEKTMKTRIDKKMKRVKAATSKYHR